MTRITPLRVCLLLFAAATLGLTGCMRGGLSTEPPVHLVLDMDFQQKLRPQAEAHFEGWTDGRSSRLPVSFDAGNSVGNLSVRPLVVAQDSLPDPKLANKDAAGKFVTKNPLPADLKIVRLGRETTLIERGRERFDIHCAVCHGYTGQGGNTTTGHGLVGRRWGVNIPNFHAQTTPGADNRVANLTDGEYFEVITNGVRSMPAYGARISPEDRWAIVHYIRALQQLSK